MERAHRFEGAQDEQVQGALQGAPQQVDHMKRRWWPPPAAAPAHLEMPLKSGLAKKTVTGFQGKFSRAQTFIHP